MLGLVTATLAGLALVVLVVADVFDVLFARGSRPWSLSRRIAALVWRLVHASGRSRLGLAGPLALVLVVVAWATFLIGGFALVYLPHVPDGFVLPAHLAEDHPAWTSLYFSAVTIGTLGYGEMTPRTGLMQVVAPVQALVGFALLTASISWFLSVHPVLARRRALAYDLLLLEKAEARRPAGSRPALADDLDGLHRRVIEVERDLVSFPITLYFSELDERHSLAAALPRLLRALQDLDPAELAGPERLHAEMLQAALDDYAATVSTFPGYREGSTADVLRTHAERHAPDRGQATG
ncbi:potassium channel family protein [Patulibacter americanus]|uniref:potassium channel family protein n=1 Tax=Patulibacter americanus TaxID=588672 RepID=UPI0003B70244|nr:potassium channel family protein [Patulibacter americanus]